MQAYCLSLKCSDGEKNDICKKTAAVPVQRIELQSREIMMGVGNRVASVIMLTFPSEPCPHADFYK